MRAGGLIRKTTPRPPEPRANAPGQVHDLLSFSSLNRLGETKIVKPAHKDLIVPNPENKNKPIAVDGEKVEVTRYIKRRLKDGDLVEVKAATKSKKA